MTTEQAIQLVENSEAMLLKMDGQIELLSFIVMALRITILIQLVMLFGGVSNWFKR